MEFYTKGFFMSQTILIVIGLCAWPSLALPKNRVVGGNDAQIGQFPHQISLQRTEDGSHMCGGSILNEQYILTAAHCVVAGNGIEPYPTSSFQVRIGSVVYATGGELVNIKRIIVHKDYGQFLNDVALLELVKPLKWSDNVRPIKMYRGTVPYNEEIIISGWGLLFHNGPIPYRLQWNTLKSISKEDCQNAISMGHDSLLCLAHEKNNGACMGDSGGPATYNDELVGVAGFVVGGCGSNNPDGYANVSFHHKWIEENMELTKF